jgi:hypothetical protein
VDAGYFASIVAGRIGRLTKLPLQFGQTPRKALAPQSAQNVHSKVNIRVSRKEVGQFEILRAGSSISRACCSSSAAKSNIRCEVAESATPRAKALREA